MRRLGVGDEHRRNEIHFKAPIDIESSRQIAARHAISEMFGSVSRMAGLEYGARTSGTAMDME